MYKLSDAFKFGFELVLLVLLMYTVQIHYRTLSTVKIMYNWNEMYTVISSAGETQHARKADLFFVMVQGE